MAFPQDERVFLSNSGDTVENSPEVSHEEVPISTFQLTFNELNCAENVSKTTTRVYT